MPVAAIKDVGGGVKNACGDCYSVTTWDEFKWSLRSWWLPLSCHELNCLRKRAQHYHRRPLCYLSICPPLFLFKHSVLSCVIRLKFIYAPFVLTVNSLCFLVFFFYLSYTRSPPDKHQLSLFNNGFRLKSRAFRWAFSLPQVCRAIGGCTRTPDTNRDTSMKPVEPDMVSLHFKMVSYGFQQNLSAKKENGSFSRSTLTSALYLHVFLIRLMGANCNLESPINLIRLFVDWRTLEKPTRILWERANLLWGDRVKLFTHCETV